MSIMRRVEEGGRVKRVRGRKEEEMMSKGR